MRAKLGRSRSLKISQIRIFVVNFTKFANFATQPFYPLRTSQTLIFCLLPCLIWGLTQLRNVYTHTLLILDELNKGNKIYLNKLIIWVASYFFRQSELPNLDDSSPRRTTFAPSYWSSSSICIYVTNCNYGRAMALT